MLQRHVVDGLLFCGMIVVILIGVATLMPFVFQLRECRAPPVVPVAVCVREEIEDVAKKMSDCYDNVAARAARAYSPYHCRHAATLCASRLQKGHAVIPSIDMADVSA